MAKLVVFYSRADENYFSGSYRYISVGNTKKVANMIAEATGADFFKIEQKVPYAADYNTCISQAKKDLQAKARPELVSMPDSLADYDEIYLGYPNWWGTLPQPVFTFLEEYDFSGKAILPLCTHEGSRLGRSENDIASVCPDAQLLDGLSVRGSDAGSAQTEVEEWIRNSGILE